ncbi:MAG: hypothetical protein ACOCP3_00350 [Halodesulfurarchaeum sp.]
MRSGTGNDREVDDNNRFGFEYDPSRFQQFLGALVPQRLSRRGTKITVRADRDRLSPGEPLPFRVVIRNRLPFPIELQTDRGSLWGWDIDGVPEGREDAVRHDDTASFSLRSNERVTVEREWNGRFRRTSGGRARWEAPTPGTHELTVYLNIPGRPRDSVNFEVY